MLSDLAQHKSKRSPKSKKRKANKKSSLSEESEWEIMEEGVEADSTDYLEIKITTIIENAVAKAVTSAFAKVEASINELRHSIEYRDQEIKDIQETTESLKCKLQEVEGRVLRCEKMVQDLKEESITMKARSMKDNIVFYNIIEYSGQGPEDCVSLLHGFLNTEMNIPDHIMKEVSFHNAHHLGGRQHGRSRPIVARCANPYVKQIIFNHARNLAGSPFGVSDQIPPEVSERRSKLMPKYREAKIARQKPKWSGDTLYVNGTAYKPPIDQDDFAGTVMSVKQQITIKHGAVKTVMGSSFQGHIAKIEETSNAIPILHQLFSNHAVAKASHNMYAYRITHQGKTTENSSDDGEFGAGKKLLDLLRSNDVKNQLVVVTRWYGGQQMGPKRFQCILEAASEVIKLKG